MKPRIRQTNPTNGTCTNAMTSCHKGGIKIRDTGNGSALNPLANVNPFDLNRKISRGSGYDIACARASSPISYQLINNEPTIEAINWHPTFIKNLNLVYLNKKMATESGKDHEAAVKKEEKNLMSRVTNFFFGKSK